MADNEAPKCNKFQFNFFNLLQKHSSEKAKIIHWVRTITFPTVSIWDTQYTTIIKNSREKWKIFLKK